MPPTPNAAIVDRHSRAWLVLSLVILLFANGTRAVPIAAWVGPVFLMRFLRTQPLGRGLALGYLASVVVFFVQWQLAFTAAGNGVFTAITAVFCVVSFAPYIADRLLARRIGGFAATLVYPVMVVLMEYLLHLVLPLGTFFNSAYAQFGNLPLLQLLSVTGLWGVSFLVAWFASIANYAWEHRGRWAEVRVGVIGYGALLFAVLFFGGVRLAWFPPSGARVKVAMVTSQADIEVLPDYPSAQLDRIDRGAATPADLAALKARLEPINDQLFERTALEARAGAKIVTWNEYDAHVLADDEPALVARAGEFARKHGIHLNLLVVVIQPDANQRVEADRGATNKILFFDPSGEVAFEYVKASLLVGWEIDNAIAGPPILQSIDSEVGRLGGVTCLDLDYPGFMRQAGQQGVDIILSGAIDGGAGTSELPLHAQMASFRAIENGMSMARAGHYGQTMAVDYQGRTLAAMPHYSVATRSIAAHLPIAGVKTIYSTVGDVVAWLCLLAFPWLLWRAASTPAGGR